MQGKNNIISEITRIHQIMGVNKQISEQVLASTPGVLFRKLAGELAQYATQKSLDKTSRSLVSKLSKGTKQITDAAGKVKNTPFDEDDYLNIFGKLRGSSDQGIRNIISAADTIITDFIAKQTIPKTLNSPAVVGKIQGDIQNGYSEDDVVDFMAKIFRDMYGIYADDVIDEFLNGVRKVYKDLGGKVDDVVDDVIDDTGKVVDDVTVGGVSNNIDEMVDEMVDGGQPPTSEQVEGAFDNLTDAGNNSREIAEVSPIFNRYQNQAGVEGVELANEAMRLIERFAELRTLVGTDRTALARQIKVLMDRINNWDKGYVEALEAEIENNIKFTDSPNYQRWLKIRSDVNEIKSTFGKWGVREVTTNLSPGWVFIKETLRSAFKLYVDIYDLIKNAKTPIQLGKDAIDYVARAFGKAPKIDNELKKVADNFALDAEDKVSFVSKYVLPGSPRGWPTRLDSSSEIDLPNSYGPIQRTARSNQYAKAWLSLFAEKILIVLRVQLEYAFLMGAIRFLQFVISDRSIMRDHGPCVLETAGKIREGTIKLDEPENFDPKNLPPCFVELISSKKLTEEQLGDFMVRAEFFSRGSGSEITGYFTPYLFDIARADILRLFTGPLAGVLIKSLDDWYEWYIEYEKTGNIIPLENELRKYARSLQTRLETVEEQATEEMENLTQSEQDSLVQLVDSIQNASGGTDFVINTDD